MARKKPRQKYEQNLVGPGWVFVILGIAAFVGGALIFADGGAPGQWLYPMLGISMILSGIGFSYGIRTCGRQSYGHGTWMIVFSVLTIMANLGLIAWIVVNSYFILEARVR